MPFWNSKVKSYLSADTCIFEIGAAWTLLSEVAIIEFIGRKMIRLNHSNKDQKDYDIN